MRLASGGGSKTKAASLKEGARFQVRVIAVLRPGLVGEGRDDEPARQRKLSKLNPDLPVDAFLVEGILLAGDALYGCWGRRRWRS